MTATLWPVDNATYHADTAAVSNSMLSVFLDPDRGPAKFHDTFLTKTLEPPETDNLIFGRLVHEDVLMTPPDSRGFLGGTVARWGVLPPDVAEWIKDREPDEQTDSGSEYWYPGDGVIRRSDHWGIVGENYWTWNITTPGEAFQHTEFNDEGKPPLFLAYCPWDGFIRCDHWKWIPPSVLAKKNGEVAADGAKSGNAWKAWAKANEGCDFLKLHQVDELLGTVAGLRANPLAKRLIYDEPGPTEQAIRWEDPDTGLQLRCRIDKLCDRLGWILDLKTATAIDHESFLWAAVNHGYHRQMAMYRRAVQALTGEKDLRPFVFVAIAKKPPHESTTFELGEWVSKLGEAEVSAGLRRLARCIERGQWTQDVHGKVQVVDLQEREVQRRLAALTVNTEAERDDAA